MPVIPSYEKAQSLIIYRHAHHSTVKYGADKNILFVMLT